MNNELTVPNVERVKMNEASLTVSVKLNLASMPCTIRGQYNIHSNSFYPSIVDCDTLSVEDEDLEAFCERNDWDFYETHSLIQEAVENRDR
jgi:hypothetical protein